MVTWLSRRRSATGLAALLVLILLAGPVPAQDRHEGYYYPEVTTTETYPARAPTLPDSDRVRRLAFVIGLAQEQTTRPYPPRWAIFAKGAEAQKLLIVALQDGVIATEYQARAMLALMTAGARSLPFFDSEALEANYTFLDLLALMGFEQLTVSDGRSYAIQYDIVLQEPAPQ